MHSRLEPGNEERLCPAPHAVRKAHSILRDRPATRFRFSISAINQLLAPVSGNSLLSLSQRSGAVPDSWYSASTLTLQTS
jgi:hypothetical protein